MSVFANHLYSAIGIGGIALLLALRTFLRLARILVIAVVAIGLVVAVQAGGLQALRDSIGVP